MRFVFLCSFALLVSSVAALSQEGDTKKSDHDRKELFDDLSEEERQKVRATLGEVWSDPAVVQARDEVRRATEAYQETMMEAIQSRDPETAKIISRMKKDESAMRQGGGKGKGGPDGWRRGGHGDKGAPNILRMIESGPFMDRLTPEQKEIYLNARTKAAESEEVKKLVAELTKMRMGEEARRIKRTALFEQIRNAYYEATVEADARVKEFLPDGLPKPGRPPHGDKPRD